MGRKLEDHVYELVTAGVPALWVESYEHEDAIETIRRLCIDPANQWRLATFDLDEGMLIHEQIEGARWEFVQGSYSTEYVKDGERTAPRYTFHAGHMPKLDVAIRSLPALNHDLRVQTDKDEGEGEQPPALLVMKNAHLLIGSPGMMQLIANQIWNGKKQRQHLVFLSPVGLESCPHELSKLVETGYIEHELPDRSQLYEIMEQVAQPDEIPEGEYLESVLDSASGLTRLEAENAFALSIVRHQETEEDTTRLLKPETIFEIKAKALKANASLSLYQGGETFADIGGLDFMKSYASTVLGYRDPNPRFRPRGILIMGVSGGGKSLFAKALGNETRRPTLRFDVGSTLGSRLGQSQAQFRQALRLADVMAPCILFIDEVEKAMAGAGQDSQTSGGVKTEMFGYFLSWLEDHTSEVYVVCTCNDIRKIIDTHPEFVERFNRLFFVDLPDRRGKDGIWEIQLKAYELLEEGQTVVDIDLPEDEGWTGRGIRNCCEEARLMRRPVGEVGKTMPRLIDQASSTIQATREWADGKAYAAEYEDLFKVESHQQVLARLAGGNGGPRRKVRRRRSS